MGAEASALTIQLLEWILVRPRSYEETMDAWRSSCPRLSIWEDALLDGLVGVDHVEGSRLAVRVTSKGAETLRSWLASSTAPAGRLLSGTEP